MDEQPLPAAAERGDVALLIGAITRDFIAGEGGADAARRGEARPGGVVYHAGCALARLGLQVRVVTRLRRADAPLLVSPLEAERIETLALPSRATTTYVLDYRGPLDLHELCETSDPIGPDDIPETWRAAELIQLGPLHRRDLLPGIAAGLRGFTGLDVQGLVRQPGPEGQRLSSSPELPAFLSGVDVVQASEQELPAVLEGESLERFARRRGIPEMVVTRGARGTVVVTPEQIVEVPAPQLRRRRSGAARQASIGAGDVFLASYLLLRVRGRDPVGAAAGASQVCAAKIRHGELPKGSSLEELLR